MKVNQLFGIGVVILTLVIGVSCGGDDDDGGSSAGKAFGAPQVEPAVAKAIPSGLTSTSKSLTFADAPEILMKNFFTNNFAKISGGEVPGIINAALEDLDSRMAEVEKRGLETAKACYETPAKDLALTSIVPSSNITLKLQCFDKFEQTEGEQSLAGSGMAFGASGDDYSLWLQLIGTGNKHGYFANINKTTEKVEFLSVSDGREQFNRMTVYKVVTDPATNSYEMSFGTTSNEYSTCGFQLKSDGTVILATGTSGDGGDCTTQIPFEICLDAKTYAVSTACSAITFELDPITSASLDTAGADSASAMLNLDLANPVATDFKQDAQTDDDE